MDILDKLIQEWSWRTEKGYPDLTNEDDLKILKEVFGINLNEGLKEKEAVRKIIANDLLKHLFLFLFWILLKSRYLE